MKSAEKHLSKDKKFKELINELEILTLPKSDTVFHELVKSIAYQQISWKAADSIFNKFISFVGTEDYLPEDLLHFTHDEFRSCGFSNAKSQYIRNIADYFVENKVEESIWDNMTDQEIIKMLTEIKGVGEWTVQMILLFQLERPDVFPSKDLGIQLAMKHIYGLESEKSALIKDMVKIAEKWRPYRSIASRYLWAWKRVN